MAISDLLVRIGDSFRSIVGSPSALYAIYLISTFILIYILVRFALQVGFAKHSNNMQNKHLSAIALMIALIATPALFFGRSAEDVIQFLSSAAAFTTLGFLLILLNVLIIGHFVFGKFEAIFGKREYSVQAKIFWTSLSIFITTSLFVPLLESRASSAIVTDGLSKTIYGAFVFSQELSAVLVIILGFMMISKLFKKDAFESNPYGKDPNSVDAFRAMVKSLQKDISETDKVVVELVGDIKA